MIVEINLADYDRPFIYQLAERATSPEILDQIVDYAINIDHYGQEGEHSCDEDFYMDMVVDNEHLSRASIIKLIHYQGASDIHFCLVDGDKIDDDELEKLFLSEVEDLSAIDRYFEKHDVSTELADMVAERLMSGKIRTKDCFNYNVGNLTDEVEVALKRICDFCSRKVATKLTKWWRTEKNDVASEYTGFADTIAERIMSETINAKLPDKIVYLSNAINSLELACSDEVAAKLNKWWNETQKG